MVGEGKASVIAGGQDGTVVIQTLLQVCACTCFFIMALDLTRIHIYILFLSICLFLSLYNLHRCVCMCTLSQISPTYLIISLFIPVIFIYGIGSDIIRAVR